MVHPAHISRRLQVLHGRVSVHIHMYPFVPHPVCKQDDGRIMYLVGARESGLTGIICPAGADPCQGVYCMKTRPWHLALIGLVIFIAAPVPAAVITISNASSIQTTINAAGSGDTILLNPGTYFENDIVIRKDITIGANTAAGGNPNNTFIDARVQGHIFINNIGSYFLIVDNLTLRNGYSASGTGTAIYAASGTHVSVNSTIIANCSAYSSSIVNLGTMMITSSTFTNCSSTASGAFVGGGGAIGNAGILTILSSTFTNCSSTGFGGAINVDDGIMTVTSSTFSDCSALYGGAVYFSSPELLSVIESSTFTNCSAYSGGAIHNANDIAIQTSSFLDCSAQYGSVIYNTGGTVIEFSRIYHNSGIAIDNSGRAVDASNNWWGTNSDPSGYTHGGVIVAPWMVLNITATPSSITGSQTTLIRINLTNISDGTDTASRGTFIPAGIPVAFARTSGTGSIAPQAGNITAGANTTTFTPAGAGTSTVSATVDGQTVSVGIKVSDSPAASKIGVFRNGHGWFLDSSGNGVWSAAQDTSYGFGMTGDVPVTGDWNHDGTTEIGVFRNGHGWFLDSSGNGVWSAAQDTSYGFGMTGDVPVTGDWNHDGTTEIGVFRNGHGWFLDSSGNGVWSAVQDTSYGFGMTGDVPVTGDWNHDGTTEIGVFRNGHGWFLDTSGDGIWDAGDTSYGFGMTGDVPVTGDWNGDGTTEIGVFRNGHGWFLDTSGDGIWDAGDTSYGFGMTGDVPVTGNWK